MPVQLLAWAKEKECPWVVRVCTLATKYAQLEALQWVREHRCPWIARLPLSLRARRWSAKLLKNLI